MNNLKFILIAAVAAIMVLSGIELFERSTETPLMTENPSPVEFNGYSEGINTIRFDPAGNIEYTLSATRQITYRDAVTVVEDPYIQLYRDDDSRWNILARSGRISSTIESTREVDRIELSGGVEVYQIDVRGNRTVLATDVLYVDPSAQTLDTSGFVTLDGENFQQSATGMRINLATEVYEFQRDIRGRYAVPAN